jgi:ribosomal protein S18 acetylase RimI-like enzyme
MTAALRPARSTDAGKIGDILNRFQNDTDWMPKLYSGAQVIAYCGEMIERGWVIVAMDMSGSAEQGTVIGFIARDGEEICSLYVSHKAKGKGVGQLLIDDAKSHADQLRVQVFEVNGGARRFYRRIGFNETGQGDGSGNDENLPDVSYVWRKDAGK